MTESAAPTVVGRYVLHAPIARGGMATIHLARLIGAEGFSRMVAAKRLHETRQSWSGSVLLALVADEETGGQGSRFLLANGHTDADAATAPTPSSRPAVGELATDATFV